MTTKKNSCLPRETLPTTSKFFNNKVNVIICCYFTHLHILHINFLNYFF